MKKLMFSLCALCLVGAASAQVSQRLHLSEKALQLSPSSALHQMKVQDMQKDSKARRDSVAQPQSAYEWDGYLGETTYLFYPSNEDQKNNAQTMDPCTQDVVRWMYGTGGPITWAGTGEFGYRFHTGADTYYQENFIYPHIGVPYAASTTLLRFMSTSMGDSLMPFYFKLYDYTKVSPQRVIASLDKGGYRDVVYPTDPERYSALTDTIWVPASCEKQFPDQFQARAEFKDVAHWKRLGEDFCLSMMFPIDWDEEGDSIRYFVGWNVMPWIMGQENHKEVISEVPHSVYYVYDFERITNWDRTEDKKRYDEFVAEESMQPNTRYAIIPFDSWFEGDIVGEPYMRIYYSEWTSLQSANKADRYVQVSPVPAVDYVNFSSYADMSRIEIYSLGGQLVKAVNVSGDTYRLDLTGMNSGMYVARIYSEKGISSKKLIVR